MIAKDPKGVRVRTALFSCIITVAVLFISIASSSHAAQANQLSFSTSDEAVKALVAALRADDEKGMLAVLGPMGKEVISSGDEVADRTGRESFLNSYEEMHSLVEKSASTFVLNIGKDNWTLPIPIVKKKGKWTFDTARGKQEILNRRIGRNELLVLETIHAYVEAQHEYATKDCSSCGKVAFAQRLISTLGKRDGLYWEAKEGEQESPLGPLVAKAASEGYDDVNLSPFHGYYFKILKGQGKHAEGGAYDYVVKGKMILGFALVAYPAEYGNSGVMTFMVNQKGEIRQKNLGKKSREHAEAMKIYNPDKSWKKVKEK